MPPRAKPVRRLAVEAELTEAQRLALGEACSLLAVPLDRWHLADFAPFWVTLAARQLAERLQARGATWEAAHDAACARLGIDVDTLRSRLKRWRASAFRPAA